jgi:hypothetical protein
MERLRKHHYVPVFYLQQWADDRGRLLKFSRPYGPVVKHEPTSPRKTGYQRGLYRVPNVPEHLAEIIEQGFMRKMDDLAALVLGDFIAKQLEGWTVPRREAWSRFIVGLMLRNPESLERIKAELERHAAENYEKWREEYERIKKPGVAPFESIDALQSAKVMLWSLDKLINNKTLLDNISALQWGMVDVSGAKYRLVTSDRPVVRTDGLSKAGLASGNSAQPDSAFHRHQQSANDRAVSVHAAARPCYAHEQARGPQRDHLCLGYRPHQRGPYQGSARCRRGQRSAVLLRQDLSGQRGDSARDPAYAATSANIASYSS